MSKIDLYNGDCLDILKNIDVSKCIIVSDPPFNIGYHYNQYKDKLDDDCYLSMMENIFKLAPSVIIHYPEKLYSISHKMELIPQKIISWVYNSNTAKQHRDIAFFNIKPDMNKIKQPYKPPNDKRIKDRIQRGFIGSKLYDWWNINQVKNVSKDKTEHPCQMPLEVMLNIVGILPDDCTIIDPFMGSGTTGVACKKLNRNFIGIELDDKYFNIAKERIENEIQNI